MFKYGLSLLRFRMIEQQKNDLLNNTSSVLLKNKTKKKIKPHRLWLDSFEKCDVRLDNRGKKNRCDSKSKSKSYDSNVILLNDITNIQVTDTNSSDATLENNNNISLDCCLNTDVC